jgi:hypothetical protein
MWRQIGYVLAGLAAGAAAVLVVQSIRHRRRDALEGDDELEGVVKVTIGATMPEPAPAAPEAEIAPPGPPEESHLTP